MLFYKFDFMIAFLLFWLFLFLIKSTKAQKGLLMISSIGYYLYWEMVISGLNHKFPYYLILFVLTAYFCFKIKKINFKKKSKTVFFLGLLIIFFPLITIKYSFWSLRVILDLFPDLNNYYLFKKSLTRSHVISLPLGISFFTFQLASYYIDNRRDNEKNKFHNVLHFLFFFPQLIAGPIMRTSELFGQLKTYTFNVNEKDIERGHFYFFRGVLKKALVGDLIGLIVDPVYASVGSYSLIYLFLVTTLYAFQIYCDFSGYSDMAKGLGHYLGINIPINFNFPYLARNISDFWRKWHVSLSYWFRDYVYIPLGGSRGTNLQVSFSIFITFLLSGIWHGAGTNYIIWGGYHGLMLVILKTVGDRFQLNIYLSRLITFAVVVVGWIFFRINNIKDLNLIKSLAILDHEYSYISTILVLSIVLYCFHYIENRLNFDKWVKNHFLLKNIFYIFILLSLFIVENDSGRFIYFQF